jgi:DNA-binding MarR family transcriptional regulator
MTELTEEDQIVAAIRQIIRAVDLQSRRLAEAYGLTGPQLAALKELRRRGALPPSSLARRVHLSQATVTGIIKRLEKRGLVERTPSDSDRRSIVLALTDAGRELLDQAPSLLQDRFREGLSSLQQWERLQILATLQRVADLMDAQQIDAAPHLTAGEIGIRSGDGDGVL